MLLPLQGAPSLCMVNPGRCPGLGAFGPWLSLRPPISNSARANIVSKNVHDFEPPTLQDAPALVQRICMILNTLPPKADNWLALNVVSKLKTYIIPISQFKTEKLKIGPKADNSKLNIQHSKLKKNLPFCVRQKRRFFFSYFNDDPLASNSHSQACWLNFSRQLSMAASLLAICDSTLTLLLLPRSNT